MARRNQVILEDDIDGGNADQTVAFALNGVSYEIDLSDKHTQQLNEALEPFLSKARRVGGASVASRRPTRGSTKGAAEQLRASSTKDAAEQSRAIRAWAKDNGHTVSDRGRISAHIVAAYESAH